MSQENVELVRRAIEYFGETEQVAVECYDPEIEFTTRSDGPGQATYHGSMVFGVASRTFGRLGRARRSRPRNSCQRTTRSSCHCPFTSAHKAGSSSTAKRPGSYCVRDGKICRMEQHASKQEALEAAGLRE
jgi:hypothetical protein